MNPRMVIFVAFQEQDNLGVGYLGAMLMQNDFEIKIIDFRMGKEVILEQIRACDPLAVGFSIIFQYHILEFRDLLAWLRQNGVSCHFCAGGHYPSLRYQDLFNIIPELDSIVLFEGEKTFLELVQALVRKADWRKISGIAYHEAGSIVATPLRPLELKLDLFPPPVRPPLREYALGKKYATLIASRGCIYDCSYCSIREFYRKPPGSIKRYRQPEWVVREMELLHEQKQCSLFMFQDDDFPVSGQKGKAWASRFCDLLAEKKLSQKIMFKINCRPDEIDSDLFLRLKESGLFLVYIGLESGTDEGLRLMNKHTTAQMNLAAVQTIKRLGLEYDYGFMLFDPTSRFETLLANLDFLESICLDGSSPLTFCKMLPYAGTKIEKSLLAQDRLKGVDGFWDYDFLDPRIDRCYEIIFKSFRSWISDRNGVLNLATWVRYYLAVLKRYFTDLSCFPEIENESRELIADSNRFLLGTLRDLCLRFQASNGPKLDHYIEVEAYLAHVQKVQQNYEKCFSQIIETIERIASEQHC